MLKAPETGPFLNARELYLNTYYSCIVMNSHRKICIVEYLRGELQCLIIPALWAIQ